MPAQPVEPLLAESIKRKPNFGANVCPQSISGMSAIMSNGLCIILNGTNATNAMNAEGRAVVRHAPHMLC